MSSDHATPVAALMHTLDKVQDRLTSQDLAGVLFEGGRLATALSVAAIATEAQDVGHLPAPDTGRASRLAEIAQLGECHRALPKDPLAEWGPRLRAYVEEVTARSDGCAVPPPALWPTGRADGGRSQAPVPDRRRAPARSGSARPDCARGRPAGDKDQA